MKSGVTYIEDEAAQFAAQWNTALALAPELKLDGTWPSVGTLDLLLWPLRDNKNLADWQAVVRGASCYLGVMTKRIWEACGVRAVLLDRDGLICVATAAFNGSPWSGGICEIQRHLTEQLLNPPEMLPLIRQITRPLGPECSLISPMMGAIFTGVDPWTFYAVPYYGENLEDQIGHRIGRLARVLASDCVARYEQLYPDDQHGQVAELFLSGLVFPPFYIEEEAPACGRAVELIKFFRGYGIGDDHIRRVCGRLARWPDEQISLTAYIVGAAMAQPRRSGDLVPLGQAKGLVIGTARKAYMAVRKEIGAGVDWLNDELTEADVVAAARHEEQLSFLPWLYMEIGLVAELISRDDIRAALKEASDFRLDVAVKLLDDCLTGEESDMDLRLQAIYWLVLQGKYAEAETRTRQIAAEDAQCTKYPRFLEITGMLAMQRGDLAKAVESFERGLPLYARELSYQSNLANSLAWAYFSAGVLDRASYLFDLALRDTRNPVTILLNKLLCFQWPNSFSKRSAWEARICKLAPNDKRVVNYLAMNVLAPIEYAPVPVPATPPPAADADVPSLDKAA